MTNLMANITRAKEIKSEALRFTSLTLNPRQLNDLEMLMTGGFSPLTGFMGKTSYQSVRDTMRLPTGELWPIPVMLDAPVTKANEWTTGDHIALRDPEGLLLAVLTLEEIWQPDLGAEAEEIFGTADPAHSGVAALFEKGDCAYLAGKLEGVQRPLHYAFSDLWLTPDETAATFQQNRWPQVIAFQTSRVIHRVHHELLVEKAREYDAALLLHPSLGPTRQGNIEATSRVRCYQAVLPEFPANTLLSLCPLAMRQAGPREALWHGLIEKNFGASHFLVGPNDSSPRDESGEATFYSSYAAHELIEAHRNELEKNGIQPICVEERVYDLTSQRFVKLGELSHKENGETFREEKLAHAMQCDLSIPDWWSFDAVKAALAPVYPPRARQGFTLFFTGLSGSGKSTVANIVNAQLVELGTRPVTLLDGDVVRLNLSSELGFSREHRDLNVRRIGFVANEISKNGGVAICAPIAPYAASRREVRDLVRANGGFIEIHVSTPLSVCEARDRKGLYAKARAGLIKEFTGISDPYETPEKPEITLDTSQLQPLEAASVVLDYLRAEGYLPPAA